MDVVIFGNGGHGADIAATIDGTVYFYDDKDECRRPFSCPYPWLIGVNDSKTRRSLVSRFEAEPLLSPQWYHGGCWIHPAAHRGPSVTLGRHTHVNAGAFLTRCTLGDFVTVGPNAVVCGDVTIGDDVMIGAGAVVRNLLTIGDGAVIGAGAVVVKDVPPGVTVVGNPARPL